MNRRNSIDTDTISAGSITTPNVAPERARLRQVERKLDYNISRFGVAMDHLATKVNGTAHFFDKVSDVMHVPQRGLSRFRANPDTYVRKSLMAIGILAAFKVFRRDYKIVTPFSRDF